MKRTLGIIFTLLMIMVAFVACEMVEEGDPLPPPENTETTPAGTVTIKPHYTGSSAKNHYYVGHYITRLQYDITISDGNGGTQSGAMFDVGDLVVEIKEAGETEWKTISFNDSELSRYTKAGEATIKAYKPGKESIGGSTEVQIYETGPVSAE